MSPQDTQDTLIGRTLGRFEIVRELGRGAMGIVYEARDPAIGRRVAVKTVKTDPSIGIPAEVMERFRREASAAGALSHQNIVTVYDVGEQEGIVYIAMEFLDGRPLDEVLAEQRCLPIDECIELVAQVLDGLSHAHEHGVVHRDVKPANIVINNNGVAKVADFGIAHTVDSTLTRTGTLIGTPNYMSPEQFAAGHIDGRSDLFSAAVILYELLTGERAFHGDNLSTMMHNVMNVEPVPVRKVNLHVPEPLAAVLEKAMSKDPLRRYQTAAGFAAALRESVKEFPQPSALKLKAPETGSTAQTVVHVLGSEPAEETIAATVVAGTESPLHVKLTGGLRSKLRLVVVAVVVTICLAVTASLYMWFAGSGQMTPLAPGGPGGTEPGLEPVMLWVHTVVADPENSFSSKIVDGADVWIHGQEFGVDGFKIGTTPLEDEAVHVRGGQYTLRATHTQFGSGQQELNLIPGETVRVDALNLFPE